MSTSLEEERRALLARMHASREVYRSRFPETLPESKYPHAPAAPALPHEHAFPRSHTFKLIRRVIHRIRGKQP